MTIPARPAHPHPLRRWLVVIAVTLIWLFLAIVIEGFNGRLQPWVYEVLT